MNTNKNQLGEIYRDNLKKKKNIRADSRAESGQIFLVLMPCNFYTAQ
jgi:hypothetical protein